MYKTLLLSQNENSMTITITYILIFMIFDYLIIVIDETI